jgi:hypothetical protein
MTTTTDEELLTIQDAAKSLNDQVVYPLIDADRTESEEEVGRQVFHDFGEIEPYCPDTDFWCRVPIRLSHNQAAGEVIEIGPFDLGKREIAVLKRAIDAWGSVEYMNDVAESHQTP